MTHIVEYTDVPALIGKDLGFSSWFEVTQDRVNMFADATDDHQWIHVDPVRAASGPFGGPVAHGFLTLSLTIPMWTELLDVQSVTTKVNYGLDRVRFVSPVAVGSRVRMTATVVEVTKIPGGLQMTVDQTVEIDGGTKPALVARGLSRLYA